jgi:hypothetical protein
LGYWQQGGGAGGHPKDALGEVKYPDPLPIFSCSSVLLGNTQFCSSVQLLSCKGSEYSHPTQQRDMLANKGNTGRKQKHRSRIQDTTSPQGRNENCRTLSINTDYPAYNLHNTRDTVVPQLPNPRRGSASSGRSCRSLLTLPSRRHQQRNIANHCWGVTPSKYFVAVTTNRDRLLPKRINLLRRRSRRRSWRTSGCARSRASTPADC